MEVRQDSRAKIFKELYRSSHRTRCIEDSGIEEFKTLYF